MKDTIKSSREIDSMFRSAAKAGSHSLLVLARKTPEKRGPTGRVAFVAGKRLGGAVRRNRAKRVLRQAARDLGGPWPGWDVVLVARKPAEGVGRDILAREMTALLSQVGVTD